MKNAIKTTQLLAVFFVGVIIGGVIFGDTATWIAGLILLGIDIVVGLILQYKSDSKKTQAQKNELSRKRSYITRVNKIFNDPTMKAYFTPKEIVNSIINLIDAKRNLTSEEFSYVYKFFIAYTYYTDELLLSKKDFFDLCNEIIAHFDLIAPYYKFCGDRRMEVMALLDELKEEYRQRAKELLRRPSFPKEEWEQLHKEFLEEFHS